MPFAATWMDLDILILSEVSQSENEKYCMTYITYCMTYTLYLYV